MEKLYVKESSDYVKCLYYKYKEKKEEIDATCPLGYTEDIYDDADNIKKINMNSLLNKVSVVILTANVFEMNVLHSKSYNNKHDKIIKVVFTLFKNTAKESTIYGYIFKINDKYILNLHANSKGSYTIGGSSDLVKLIINEARIFPKIIISFGVCFGLDFIQQNIGEVLISKKIVPYFMGLKIRNSEPFFSEENFFYNNTILHNELRMLFNSREFKKIKVKSAYDPLITGEAVIDDKYFRDFFKKCDFSKDAVGGEMEGYGLYKECVLSFGNIPCIIVKGISDWAMGKKGLTSSKIKKIDPSISSIELEMYRKTSIEDRFQIYAVNNSYLVLEGILTINYLRKSIYDEIIETINDYRTNDFYGVEVLRRFKEKYSFLPDKIEKFIKDVFKNLCDDKVIIDMQPQNEFQNKYYRRNNLCH